MEMHQVRYFLAVCETLNFTRAADQCHVAQPSLTRAIKNLEEELGGPLFRRERNLSHLTELGRLMRPYLEQVYEASQTARQEALQYFKLDKAPLRLGLMCTIGPARLVGFMQRLKADIPSLEITVREASGQTILDELMAGEVDVALLGLPQYPDRIVCRPLYKERYVVAFPKGHRFEAMNAVPLRELGEESYLMRVNCEHPAHVAASGTPVPSVKVVFRSEREDWIQAMIGAGLGCSVIPENMLLLPGLATRLVTEPELVRTISLATVAGRRFAPAVEAVVRLAQRHPWEQAAAAA